MGIRHSAPYVFLEIADSKHSAYKDTSIAQQMETLKGKNYFCVYEVCKCV